MLAATPEAEIEGADVEAAMKEVAMVSFIVFVEKIQVGLNACDFDLAFGFFMNCSLCYRITTKRNKIFFE